MFPQEWLFILLETLGTSGPITDRDHLRDVAAFVSLSSRTSPAHSVLSAVPLLWQGFGGRRRLRRFGLVAQLVRARA